MSGVMRPHIKQIQGIWECRSRAIFGGWIVARGMTVRDAYRSWVDKL